LKIFPARGVENKKIRKKKIREGGGKADNVIVGVVTTGGVRRGGN